ncbi:carbon-nitrogen hydrolase family protein [Mycolicibacter hiberniae]|uniref:Nitrilase n=1 Tax=Mycolicibacter hiberniae TaxID=29314 RepID=A0A7I7X1T2_9MYCO|nr:carbon-nitrogen hydrolase family protein [Mycolicibacter hiberniae]MCV7085767.1 carbon-nitrogen hydrolase family protein [Mycolicibacter hiberniae]ORV69736.1 nitrilase [Mycolicibacter hiberniae]BBZ22781.1 nitrilase [Mycolicibacter hiberniae]
MPKVGVAQVGSVLFDTAGTLAKLQEFVERAQAAGVEFLVFPEAFVGGYPKGLSFGAVVGSRTPAGRDEYVRYHSSAVTVPGPETNRIGELARQSRITMVVGVIERDGGTLYCTAVYFGADGQLLGKHRKLMPTASERLIWGQGDGSTIEVFDSPAGRFAATICWENYMPQFRLATYQQGVQLWCAPTVDDRDIWQSTMRHIAYEGRCFVLSACQYLNTADLPENYARDDSQQAPTDLIRGGSVIVSPLGEVLAGPVYGAETLLVADLDLDDQIRGKYDLDVTGHYARPDVFTLTVDRSARTAVVSAPTAAPEPVGFDDAIAGRKS